MRTLLACVIVVMWGCGACTTESRARRDADAAFKAGQQSAQPAMVVIFRGFVRKTIVPWTKDLTLAEALLQAEYTGSWDPRSITVTRQGEVYRIDPKRLLRGQENPTLEAGDVVEVQR